MKKRIACIISILGIILTAIGIALNQNAKTTVSVIGGADGPTSVFIAGKLNSDIFILLFGIGIVILLLAGICLYKRKQ